MKELIGFKDFLEIEKKLEIKIGKILSVEDIPKSEKLIKLSVSFGDEDIRIVVTNIKNQLSDKNDILGKSFAFITNLIPVKIMGIDSNAMIMPGDLENKQMITINSEDGIKLL